MALVLNWSAQVVMGWPWSALQALPWKKWWYPLAMVIFFGHIHPAVPLRGLSHFLELHIILLINAIFPCNTFHLLPLHGLSGLFYTLEHVCSKTSTMYF